MPRQIIEHTGSSELTSLCERYDIQWQWDSFVQTIALKGKVTDAKLMIGSDTVFTNEQVILLNKPVMMRDSEIIVPGDFELKVFNILKKKSEDKKGRVPVRIKDIIIDAGHGGKDPGAIGRTGIKEKDVVLDISMRLYKELKARGYNVHLTRKDDTFISLAKRTEIASNLNADLFISVHANANTTRSVHGLEIYTLKDLDALEMNEAQRKDNHRLLFNNLEMDRKNNNLNRIVADLLYTHKQTESTRLAPFMADNTSKYIRARNRGMKKARFFVLRNTLIPAVLVEVGYLTNPREERLLMNNQYRHKIAQGIVKSITEYIDGEN